MTIKFLILLLLTFITCAHCAKILAIFPTPSYSHFVLGVRIAKELARKGHQITMISPYPQKTPIDNYRDISVEDNEDFVQKLKAELFDLDEIGPLASMRFVLKLGNDLTDRTFGHKNVQALLNSGETFDLVILEYFMNDALLGIAYHFKAPLILMPPSALNEMNYHFVGNPAPSSYVPNVLGRMTKHMNFWQRLLNLFFNTMNEIMREFLFLPTQRKIFKKYTETDLALDDVLYNVSLVLATGHVSIHDAVPVVPSVVNIAGSHVEQPKKLPEDIQKFMDEAVDGVVLFSMGSNLKSQDLKPEVRRSILNALSKIKQKVLWKFETDLPDAPENVKIMKWLPQQDILAHKNLRAFITHGGLLSIIETVYHGIPIIGIPVFGDQKSNVAVAASNGYAVAIPLEELSESKLSWALNEIVHNPKYRENVQQRSRVMRDQPLQPLDAAVFWVEHVIRHKGAPHLRSAALDLKWYQREMIDVFGFCILVVLTLFVIIYKTLKVILGLLGRGKPVATKIKKTN